MTRKTKKGPRPRPLVLEPLEDRRVLDASWLIHQYRLDHSLADDYGGPSLDSAGGTFGPTGYIFRPNEGLSLTNAALSDPGNYSLELLFSFDTVSSWRKIIDFKDLEADEGLYCYDARLEFYPQAIGTTEAINPSQQVRIVTTRDGPTGQLVGYVDGVEQFSFVDSQGFGIFNAPDNVMHFFMDDFVTGQIEASSGSAQLIRIYDTALTAAEVAAIPEMIPDIVATGLSWREDEPGISFTYEVVHELPEPTEARFYWANGPSQADILESAGAYVHSIETIAGQYGPFSVEYDELGIPPVGASHLLFVVDPDDLIPEANEDNNVAYLVLPNLTWASDERDPVVFNRDRDNTVANAEHRGLDFQYLVYAAPLPYQTTIAFYWADESKEIISGIIEKKDLPSREVGFHRRDPDVPGSFEQFNVSARDWPAAPPNARFIVAELDPERKILEACPFEGEYKLDKRYPLPIRSAEELMRNSIIVDANHEDRRVITADFRPAQGEATLSEAEIVLGVSHFNWRQQVGERTPMGTELGLPSNWLPMTVCPA